MSQAREVILCGGPTDPCCPACPVLKIKDSVFTIDDDYGNQIKVSESLMPDIINQIKKIKQDD